jgi:hypothetical protein
MRSSSNSVQWKKLLVFLFGWMLLVVTSSVIGTEDIVNVDTTNLRRTISSEMFHRVLQTTEELYVKIKHVDRYPQLDTATKAYYEVTAWVRVVNTSNSGYQQGNIIRFLTYTNKIPGTGSPMLPIEHRCVLAKLKKENGQNVLADGNDSLTQVARSICHVEPNSLFLRIIYRFVHIFIPGPYPHNN